MCVRCVRESTLRSRAPNPSLFYNIPKLELLLQSHTICGLMAKFFYTDYHAHTLSPTNRLVGATKSRGYGHHAHKHPFQSPPPAHTAHVPPHLIRVSHSWSLARLQENDQSNTQSHDALNPLREKLLLPSLSFKPLEPYETTLNTVGR